MAPTLGVTHLLAFTLTDVAPSLRIVRLSAGPTLSFRLEKYSLMKDVGRTSRHAKSFGTVEYLSPPLVRLHYCTFFHQCFKLTFEQSLSLRPSLHLVQTPLHI